MENTIRKFVFGIVTLAVTQKVSLEEERAEGGWKVSSH